MSNSKQPHGFCETPHEKCTMSYCDENGCVNRKRNLVGKPIEMSNNKQTTDYKYPVGDFLSGFSDDSNNPCVYELECQRMVIRGVEYLNDNQDLVDKIAKEKLGVHDEALKPMIEHMCYPEDGQTGAMVGHTVKVAYQAKKMGWDEYIKKITENNEQ